MMALGLLAIGGCNKDGALGQWTTDQRIDGASDNNDPDSSSTRMCAANDGTIYVLWTDDRNHRDNGRQDIWMNRSTELGAKGSWLVAPIKVNVGDPESDSSVSNPQMYCNNFGVYVVWEDDRDGSLKNHGIYFNESTDQGLHWLAADVALDADPQGLGNSIGPELAGVTPVGGAGGQRLFVTWYDNTFGSYDVRLASSADGGTTWSNPARLDSDDPPGGFWSGLPKIAMSNDADDVYAVFEDRRNGATDIYVAHSDNGGTTFPQDYRLDTATDGTNEPGAFESSRPQICTDGLNNVYVVWEDLRNSADGTRHDIYYQYSGDRGVTWLADAQRLETDTPGFGDSVSPVCVVQGTTAHVAWSDQRNDGDGYDIYSRDVVAGVASGEPVRLDVGVDGKEPDGFANSLDPVIAMGTDGRVAVGWSDQRGEAGVADPSGYVDLYYNYSAPGSTFETANDLRIDSTVSGSSHKSDLHLAILGGSWYAAWTDDRDLTGDIYFTTFALGDQSDPPTREELQAAAEQ
jgi:hypothetical protein